MHIKALIDKAAEIVSGRKTLAQRLGVMPNRVHDYANSVRPCPIEKQILLCDIAELDDHETREHLREAAGVQAPKPSLIHSAFGLGVLLSTVVEGVLLAVSRGAEATMYRPATL